MSDTSATDRLLPGPGDWERLAAHIAAAQKAAAIAEYLTAPTDKRSKAGREEIARAADYARKAADEAGAALVQMRRLEAVTTTVPQVSAPQGAVFSADMDLADIVTLDTRTARRLLRLLEQAWDLAESVDIERCRTLPIPLDKLDANRPRGTDLSQIVGQTVQRLRKEVAAAGRRRSSSTEKRKAISKPNE